LSRKLVVKHNELIEGRYNLSLTEAKIVAKLTSVIKKDDDDFKSYNFKAKELLEELKMNENKYTDLKQAVEKLMTRIIVIKTDNSELRTTFLSSAEYFKDSTIELSFDKKLKPYLLQLKDNFTKYYLENVLNLKSFYAIRIYELCKQYEKLQERIIEVDELKKILEIEKEKAYKLYSNIKLKILSIAEREINEKTDLKITIEEIKTGRKVTSIKFIIKKNIDTGITHEIQDDTNLPTTKENDNISKLFLLCKVQTDEIKVFLSKNIEKYNIEVFESNVKYTNKYAKDNYLAYLKKALKEDYAKTTREKKKEKKVTEPNEIKVSKEEHEEILKENAQTNNSYLDRVKNEVLKK
jgi:plasmid replication initiation protein